MGVLSNLEPKEVFYYFEELSNIPRETFNVQAASDFCVAFAKEQNLEYVQDKVGNVIVKKPGTEGYENSTPIILQGHLDMVAVKTPESSHNFKTDPLELFIEDGKIGAKDTSLGADNGIAVALAMAVLASKDIPHPPIEAIFTVDEEIGMGGAYALDMSELKGVKCLNIDSEIEGVLTVGCAGGFVCDIHIPVNHAEETGKKVQINIAGLQGGHSGAEIQKQLGNANKLMGRVLNSLAKDYDFNLISIDGGNAANVVTMRNEAVIIADAEQTDALIEKISVLNAEIFAEFMGQEPTFSLTAKVVEEGTVNAFDADSTRRVISYIYGAPDGVQCYDRAFPKDVETSLNTGIVETNEDTVRVRYQVRSSVTTKLEDLKEQLIMWCELVGASFELNSSYPAWGYNPESELRPLMIDLFKEVFGRDPVVETTHAGLECGILFDKKPDLDIISFGPELPDVHSVKERLHIDSVVRTWDYLKAILKACK